MVPENPRWGRAAPVLVLLAPGAVLGPACWLAPPDLAHAVAVAWLANLAVFLPPWVLLEIIPRLRSPTVVLAFSWLRLAILPLLLLAIRQGGIEMDRVLLGWTLGLYVLNLTSMTVVESRARA